MNAPLLIPALDMGNTVPLSRVGHRLALGVQWIDALTQMPLEPLADQALCCDLQAVGTRPWVQRLEAHTQSRHALRLAGRYQRLLARAVELAESTRHELRAFGARDPRLQAYRVDQDPRRFVPRRVALTPVLVDGLPPASTVNTRTAWLWPGAAYPLPARSTAVRGRVLRDLGGGQSEPIAWARVVCTKPGAGAPNFASEKKLGWGHGDDRGEFLLVLGASAVSGGGALPAQIPLHIWVFLPPPEAVWSADDPLASLPLEDGGISALDDVLKGRAVPAAYLPQSARALTLKLGEVRTMNEADLLF